MSIKLTLKVNSENPVKDATDLTNQLKLKNLRGVKVRQEEAEPTRGALSGGEWLPYVKLFIESGLATAVVTQLFSLLKNGFFTTAKQIEADKEIKLKELEAQQKSVDLTLECKEKKINVKFSKGDNEDEVLSLLSRTIEENCK